MEKLSLKNILVMSDIDKINETYFVVGCMLTEVIGSMRDEEVF